MAKGFLRLADGFPLNSIEPRRSLALPRLRKFWALELDLFSRKPNIGPNGKDDKPDFGIEIFHEPIHFFAKKSFSGVGRSVARGRYDLHFTMQVTSS